MPDIANVLRQEIRRLARKEVSAATSAQSKQLQVLKTTVRDLKTQVMALEKEIIRASQRGPQPEIALDRNRQIRISPSSIKRHRKRLRLSQAQMGILLGVSTTTIVFWETGRSLPRGANRASIAELREMGLRDVKTLLESM